MRIRYPLAEAVANVACTPATAIGACPPFAVVMTGVRFTELVGTTLEYNRCGVKHPIANATTSRRGPLAYDLYNDVLHTFLYWYRYLCSIRLKRPR